MSLPRDYSRILNRPVRFCVRCRGRIREGDAEGESGIYSPGRSFRLCEPCFFAEDDEIEVEGNNLPDRIKQYRENERLGPLKTT
jgi:hypothetical protein